MIRDDDGRRVKHWRDLLDSERDAAALYSRIAATETGERRVIFEELADVERRHAAHWEEKIRGAGGTVPPPGGLACARGYCRPQQAGYRPARCCH